MTLHLSCQKSPRLSSSLVRNLFCLPTATPCQYWAGAVMLQRCLIGSKPPTCSKSLRAPWQLPRKSSVTRRQKSHSLAPGSTAPALDAQPATGVPSACRCTSAMRVWRPGEWADDRHQCGIFSFVAWQALWAGLVGDLRVCRFLFPVRQPARFRPPVWRRGRRKTQPRIGITPCPPSPAPARANPARFKVSTASHLTASPPWPLSVWFARRHQQGASCRQ
jgi:hypothetical protein